MHPGTLKEQGKNVQEIGLLQGKINEKIAAIVICMLNFFGPVVQFRFKNPHFT